MTSIRQFVEQVTFSRKRTGVVLLNNSELLTELESCGLKLINLAKLDFKNIILTDDELINLILGMEPLKPVVLLNLELFLAPRFKDVKYLDYLLNKLSVKEPRAAIFFAFYSEIIFGLFRTYYASQPATENHTYEEY